MQLLALKMEGAGSQVMQSAASSWERQEIDSPWEPLEGMQSCQPLDFILERLSTSRTVR